MGAPSVASQCFQLKLLNLQLLLAGRMVPCRLPYVNTSGRSQQTSDTMAQHVLCMNLYVTMLMQGQLLLSGLCFTLVQTLPSAHGQMAALHCECSTAAAPGMCITPNQAADIRSLNLQKVC